MVVIKSDNMNVDARDGRLESIIQSPLQPDEWRGCQFEFSVLPTVQRVKKAIKAQLRYLKSNIPTLMHN